jgi:hypothetical protein
MSIYVPGTGAGTPRATDVPVLSATVSVPLVIAPWWRPLTRKPTPKEGRK